MLIARTNAEAHLYIDLHPCECGSKKYEPRHKVVNRRDGMVSVYEGSCGACGARRRFEFELPEELVAPAAELSYGGADPSTILDPGEFLWASDQYAKMVPADLAAQPPEARAEYRRQLEAAIACVSEVLKFVPEGAEAVPASAFSSERGKGMHGAEPGRFRRARLEAVLASYRTLHEAARNLESVIPDS